MFFTFCTLPFLPAFQAQTFLDSPSIPPTPYPSQTPKQRNGTRNWKACSANAYTYGTGRRKKDFGEEGRTFGCKNVDGTVHGYNHICKKKSKEKLLFSRIVVVKMRENSKRIRGMERKNKDVNNNPLIEY